MCGSTKRCQTLWEKKKQLHKVISNQVSDVGLACKMRVMQWSFRFCITRKIKLCFIQHHAGDLNFKSYIIVVFMELFPLMPLLLKVKLASNSGIRKLYFSEHSHLIRFRPMGWTGFETWKEQNCIQKACQHHFYCFLREIWILKSGGAIAGKVPSMLRFC